MSKKIYPDVRPGQVWMDRDKRMDGRRVRVVSTATDGVKVWVNYRQVVGLASEAVGQTFKANYSRFQRAFNLVRA